MKHPLRTAIGVTGFVLFLIGGEPGRVDAQPARTEYRVVFAAPREVQRRVDEAGREGFSCLAVARPELDVKLNGVVVVLGRSARPGSATVEHRAVLASGGGSDLQSLLARGGADGFGLCGVALAETSTPTLVAVMRRADTDTAPREYAAQTVGDRDSIASFKTSVRDGFVPMAATPVNDSRVAEMRRWMVVSERSALPIGRASDVVVRYSPGPDSLQKAILEHSQQGFRVDLLWKEGATNIVVLMTMSAASAVVRPAYNVDTVDPSRIHGMSGVYLGDVPYLSDGQRVVVYIRDISATTAVVEDRLPQLGVLDYASLNDVRPLGEHLSRLGNHRLTFASIRRGERGGLVLHTVLTRFSP